MSRHNSLLHGWCVCVLALALTSCGRSPSDEEYSGQPIPAVIDYSAAPWDGPAYTIEVSLESSGRPRGSSLHIDIWGNPEFDQPHTYRLSGQDTMKDGGRASYQEASAKSPPANLVGTISFATLKQGTPVAGSFDLSAAGSRRFKERFLAKWGNEPPRIIR